MVADPIESLSSRVIEKAFQCVDLAVHPNTSEEEALAAIRAYHRIAEGHPMSALAREYYGVDGETLSLAEDEWAERFQEQAIEANRLRTEMRRLRRQLDDTQRRLRQAQGETTVARPKVEKTVPPMLLEQAEWDLIVPLIPEQYRNERGRERFARIIVVLRSGCGWRSLPTWTTFYNQYRHWKTKTDWWIKVAETMNLPDA